MKIMKKITKRIFTLALFLILLSGNLFAQNVQNENSQFEIFSSSENVEASVLPENESNDEENDGKKHWISAFSGMLIFTVGLASYNRWGLGSGWAQTGWDEWDHFWERKLEWDNDWYWTNFVLHPYQGSLCYMSARNSNLNQLESFGVTFLGSYIWEYLCETNAPSKNDMVYTTIGAFSVGEMLYRLSLAADSKTRLGGILLDPMRIWSEFVTGQKPKNPHGNIQELTFRVNAGATSGYTDILGNSSKIDTSNFDESEVYPVHGGLEAYVVYNDPFTNDSNIPYTQFELKVSGNIGKGSGDGSPCPYEELDKKLMYDIEIESNGFLWSRSPVLADNVDTSVGLIMEYDFDWHSWYMLTSLAPGLAIKQRVNFDKNRFEWQLHGGWICLGTADYYYLRRQLIAEWPDEHIRTYSYTTGAETVLKLKYATDDGSNISFDFHGYAMYDFYSQLKTVASTGWELIGKGTVSAEIAVSKSVLLGLSDRIYAKRTFYKSYPDIFQIMNSASVYAKWKLK